jgi:hypothetical protein
MREPQHETTIEVDGAQEAVELYQSCQGWTITDKLDLV